MATSQLSKSALRSTLFSSGPLVAMIVVQAAVALYSIHVLSTVRAFVGGESLWSKAQKDAIYYLSRYAENGDIAAYDAYKVALEIPHGDRQARLAVEKSEVDWENAQKGFLQGGNHIDDLPGVISMLRNFGNTPLMKDSLAYWTIGDRYIDEIQQLAETIHRARQLGPVDDATRLAWSKRIHEINAEVTPFARAFSESLANTSRLIVKVLLWTTSLTALLLVALIVWRNHALITQRERATRALGNERERARITLAAIGDGVITTDAQDRVVYMNEAAERITAARGIEASGNSIFSLLRFLDDDHVAGGAPITRSLITATPNGDNYLQQLYRSDGSVVPVRVVVNPMSDETTFTEDVDSASTGMVVVLHDATQEQRFLAQLSWHASHDPLTGLVNRREFERRLEAVLNSPRPVGAEGALLYLDLDQFKIVNDTCGHQAGDYLLRELCVVLKSQLPGEHTLARLGGDEFGILLVRCSLDEAMVIAEQLRQAARETRFRWQRHELSTGISMGVVPLLPEFDSLQEVMRIADIACYRAKGAGRNKVCLYDISDVQYALRQDDMDWVRQLRKALDHDELELYAQQIMPLDDKSSSGNEGVHVELLLRLRDDIGNVVPASAFIPAAEMFGLMPEIDRWVLRRAFTYLAENPRLDTGQPIITCAINLSGASVGDDGFRTFIKEQFRLYPLQPSLFCFEITETNVIAHLPDAQRLMEELRAMGCRFALDDFGAGMSSFRYLKHLPVDYLKIDGSLVRDMLDDTSDHAMIEMINHLAQVLGKHTIAEFAESLAIIDELRRLGINYAQGYGVSKPQPLMRR